MKTLAFGGVWLPLGLFVAVLATLGLTSGLRPATDSWFFVTGAERLRAGHIPPFGYGYFGYISWVAMLQSLGLGTRAIVVGQCVLSAVVVVVVYDMGRRIAGPLAGTCASVLYAIDIDIHRFAFYVLSDSLFTSAVVLALYAAYRAVTERSRGWTLAAVLAAVMMGSMRFNGWFMLPVLAEWMIQSSGSSRSRRWAIRAALVACYVPVVFLALRVTGSPTISDELFRGGRVVWNDPTTALLMPAEPGEPSGPLHYLQRHPVASIRLMAMRSATEVAHVRRFYSRAHNAAIVVLLWPLYVAALFGWWTRRETAICRVSLLLCAVNLTLVAVAAADWDGRYMLMIMPIVIFWSGIGIAAIAGRLLSQASDPELNTPNSYA
jgi:4-amino-4-deoxy-L-arabinose transferase-like glycosyltransferase